MDSEAAETLWRFMTLVSCFVNLTAFLLILLCRDKFSRGKKNICKGRRNVVKMIITVLVLADCMNICRSWNPFHAYTTLRDLETSFFQNYDFVKLLAQIFGMAAVLLLWTGMERDKETIEEELKGYELYNGAYEEIVEVIRMRQHEFENHLNAILCMGSTIHNYDELVDAQKEYCKEMVQENKLNKIVKPRVEPVITGFLYTKISQAESFGIEVQCEVHAIDTKQIIKTHDLIEVIGILIDNAIDAIKEYDGQKIIIRLAKEEAAGFVVEIANTSRVFQHSELEKFCEYGYSSKGSGRGLGLARLKMIADKNAAELSIENRELEDRNYLVFKVIFGQDEKLS